jgi:hypothetical protein
VGENSELTGLTVIAASRIRARIIKKISPGRVVEDTGELFQVKSFLKSAGCLLIFNAIKIMF